MEQQPNFENQNLNQNKNPYKILFFVSLGLFLIVSSVLTTLLITQKSSNLTQTIPTDTEETEATPTETTETDIESITTVPTEFTVTPTKSATSSSKTAFQKMTTNLNLYKDITSEEREFRFSKTTSASVFWPSWVKNTDKLYPFAQKLIKGSIKILTIDHRNLNAILTDEDFKNGYDYTFYLTPNYENWTNSEFKNLKYEGTGIGDLTPIYAYSDKLIWTTRNNCGGARSESIEGQKVQDQCQSLIQEMETAFP